MAKMIAKIKNVVFALLVIFLASFFLGCIGTKETKLEPKTEGKALYSYITAGNNYKNWDKWPGTGEFYPKSAGSPHGDLLITYVNDKGLSGIQGKIGSLPDGSIMIKENYMPDKTLAALTVMYKEKGYDPAHNDWFWAKYSPTGEVQAEGKVGMCNDCHGKQKDNDYTFTGPLK